MAAGIVDVDRALGADDFHPGSMANGAFPGGTSVSITAMASSSKRYIAQPRSS